MIILSSLHGISITGLLPSYLVPTIAGACLLPDER
jgi:hypothetical protein